MLTLADTGWRKFSAVDELLGTAKENHEANQHSEHNECIANLYQQESISSIPGSYISAVRGKDLTSSLKLKVHFWASPMQPP